MKTVFELQLPDLLCFVKESCHKSLHETLRDLRVLNEEVSDILPELSLFLKSFIHKVQIHLAQEENHLFPGIESGKVRKEVMRLDHLIIDHDDIKTDLLKIRRMTHNYQDAYELNLDCVNYYRKLQEMDRIILNHIQIEDHILFPMVREIS